MLKKILVLTVFVFLLPVALAGQTQCVGSIERFYVTNTGVLAILPTFRNGWLEVCGTNSVRLGIPTETCKVWFTMVQAAYIAGTDIRISYSDADVAAGACGSIPAYGGSPAPRYMMADPAG